MEIRDRLPPAQVFLGSLRERLGPGTPLFTTFTPSYSERFFLQVVDGFVLDQVPSDRSARPHGLVLVKKTDTGQQASDTFPGNEVLTRYDNYLLVSRP